MPAKCRWLLQIPEIVEQVSALRTPVLDRALCEKIFGLGRRRTIQVMHQFGGYQAVNTVLIDREVLLDQLRLMLDNPAVEQERRRKRRLSEELA